MSSILSEVYGEQTSFRLNQDTFRGKSPDELDLRKLFPAATKVLSGHLPYRYVKRIVEADSPKLITWLRDPVERVISNYYWRVNLDRNSSGSDDEQVQEMTIEEYIRIPKNQNRISYFLNGLSLDTLYFMGFLETYDQDLLELSRKLNWSHCPHVHINVNPTFKKMPRTVSQELRDEIIQLNQEDIHLFEEAKLLQSSINSR